MNHHFPIEEVRHHFPALNRKDDGKPIIYFDAPGGTQMADYAIENMYHYLRNGVANLHGTFQSSIDTDNLLAEARQAAADLLGCNDNEVAFGANMTTMAFSISRALVNYINEGDEIVVTELDHHANVDPWLSIAKQQGAVIKFIRLNQETLTLDLASLDELITSKTRLVAVGMSSNVTGTVTDVKAVIEKAKEHGALVVIDAVHAVPHLKMDMHQLGCDILLCSAYKFFGPHVGIAAIKAALFEKLTFHKLQPAPGSIPYKLETGTQNHEGIAGILGAIQFIRELGQGKNSREQILSGMERIDEYEKLLSADLESFLLSQPDFRLYRPTSGQKTSTFSFTIKNHDSREVTKWLAQYYNLCVADGDFYAANLADILSVRPYGGWIRVGLTPYNTLEEIETLKEALQAYIKQTSKIPL
ncbi:cysteine desulfurase-like protein [Cytobacillus horneckiae]|uniref:Cysteine desulfurase-like protein n=1 Tax=Cytobacillus horneckiae TaxID=549687 RepID=A0A2N0ZFG9_9BACI|nr:cysteine desulfurase-like protein [Cytobacillus horneckiae]MEC1154274.1 cysteine desulfurase-like protein [Cytobacillus horneckiae]MED2937610.1 cysteine desulfurase-like protein [Cytobacillus horneckiae]PKG28260.1 cysteine desulfurase-like protein [Cytobacillus horneckiae]